MPNDLTDSTPTTVRDASRAQDSGMLPSWLSVPESYEPSRDRDGFVTRNMLTVTSTLAQLRLDAGRPSAFSPTAPIKLIVALACILLTSLAHNYLFVLIMLALVLVRTSILPKQALPRVAYGATAAAVFAGVIMLPAAFIGQPQSAALLGTKAFVCTAIALLVSLTTPPAQLTGSLRAFGVPGIVIMTIDLALRSVVCLGRTAGEVLTALSMRSVGKNRNKQASIGGVGGVLLLKAGRNAQDTLDAMRCRGFTGTYEAAARPTLSGIDVAWLAGLALLCLLFFHLQGAL